MGILYKAFAAVGFDHFVPSTCDCSDIESDDEICFEDVYGERHDEMTMFIDKFVAFVRNKIRILRRSFYLKMPQVVQLVIYISFQFLSYERKEEEKCYGCGGSYVGRIDWWYKVANSTLRIL